MEDFERQPKLSPSPRSDPARLSNEGRASPFSVFQVLLRIEATATPPSCVRQYCLPASRLGSVGCCPLRKITPPKVIPKRSHFPHSYYMRMALRSSHSYAIQMAQ